MKRTGMMFLTIIAAIGIMGCKSKPTVESDKTMFDFMQEEVGRITDKGGMAAVGLGESRNTQLAITKAKVEARKNLAQIIQTKIENLEKSFIEEVGKTEGSEINSLFSTATKQITSQTLQGSAPKMQKYETREGMTTAYVLMVMNPEIINESLKSQNNMRNLYERFRASEAFEELDKEIKEFEAAEKAGMLGM